MLEDVRQQKYTTPDKGNLCWRPWRINENIGDGHSFKELKEIYKTLYDGWPKSKLMDLRTALSRGKSETKTFKDIMEKRGLKLPGLSNNDSLGNMGWQDDKTPYFDAIELGQLYPLELMEEERENG